MVKEFLNYLNNKLSKYTIEKLDDYTEMRYKEYGGIKMYSGHYRIRHRNNYGFTKEKDLTNFIDYLPSNTVMWDVGANVGYFSLYAAKKGMKVLAFEPDQITCGVLNKNIFLNNSSNNIIAIPLALNDENKVSTFFMRNFKPANAYNTFDRSTNEWGKEFLAEFTQGAIGMRGNDLILDGNLADFSNPEFVKIDVDGNELKVIRGMSEVLKKAKYLCAELGSENKEFTKIQEILLELGYKEIDDERFVDLERKSKGMRNYYYSKS